MSEADEWVTVAEAARHAGVSDRTARRYVARMDSSAVRRTGRTGRSVRLTDFLAAVAVSNEIDPDRTDAQDTDRPVSADRMDSPVTANADKPDRAEESDQRLIEQLQSENARLWGELQTRAQEIERRDVAESELRRLLLADREELRRLRSQLAIAEAPAQSAPTTEDTASASPMPVPDDLGANAADNAHEASLDGQVGGLGKNRGWWDKFLDVLLYRQG